MEENYYLKRNSPLRLLVFLLLSLISTFSYAEFELTDFKVYDLIPQQQPTMSYGSRLIAYDGLLFFSASDQGLGAELWAVDLTTKEQFLVQDINEGVRSSTPTDFVIYQEKLYFSAYTEEYGRELWVYDATNKKAHLVRDTNNNLIGGLTSSKIAFTVFDDKLYFLKNSSYLWYFDGEKNTFSQHESGFIFYYSPWFYYIPQLQVINEALFIISYNSEEFSDKQAWKLNQETNKFIELDTSKSNIPFKYTVATQEYLYSYDYTPDLAQYSLATQETINFEFPSGRIFNVFPLAQDVLISTHNQLYRFSLASQSSILLKNYPSTYQLRGFESKHMTQIGNKVYLLLPDDSEKLRLWQLDLDTNEVTPLLPKYMPQQNSSNPQNKIIYHNQLHFSATNSDGNIQLWTYDPSEDKVSAISTFTSKGTIGELTIVQGKLYFVLSLTENNHQLWQYEYQTHTFTHVTLFESEAAASQEYTLRSLVELNNELYFIAQEKDKNTEIWSYDPAEAQPKQHSNFSQSQSTSIFTPLVKYRNSIYFGLKDQSSSNELWYLYSKSKSYNVLTTSQEKSFTTIDDLIVLNNKLYFTHNNDAQLSYYDNTTNKFSDYSITMPTDIYVDGTEYADLTMHLATNDKLVYVNNHRFAYGVEPYYYSELTQENSLLADIVPGYCCIYDQSWEGFQWGSYPNNFYSFDNVLYFNAGSSGDEGGASQLWSAENNNTLFEPPNKLLLSSIYDRLANVTDIIGFNGALFATANVTKDGVNFGTELVKLDINITPSISLNVPEQVIEGRVLLLDASNSTDEDGDELSFNWQQISGTNVEIIDANSSKAYFTAPSNSDIPLVFELTLTDGNKETKQTVSVHITENFSPTITLVNTVDEVIENSSVNIEVDINDANNDELTVSWQQISGPEVTIDNTDLTNTVVTVPNIEQDSVVEIQITVSDGLKSTSVNYSLTVKNKVIVSIENDNKSGGVISFLLLLGLFFIRILNQNK